MILEYSSGQRGGESSSAPKEKNWTKKRMSEGGGAELTNQKALEEKKTLHFPERSQVFVEERTIYF